MFICLSVHLSVRLYSICLYIPPSVCTENLILQDFVLYWGAALPPPMKTKEKVEQGKGTADHLIPLGYFFNSAKNMEKTVMN